MDENKRKHLEMIQAVINRMARNSFLLRGWAVALLAAVLALSAAKNIEDWLVTLALIPLISFWGLDGYFLAMERRYRDLYDDVRQLEDRDINFSMNTSEYSKKEKNTWFKVSISQTVWWFYGPLTVAVIVVFAVFFLVGK